MGKWMAHNVLKAGFELTVFDVAPEAVKSLVGKGAQAVGSAAEMATQMDWVLLSLPDTAVVEQVIFGDDGLIHGARPGLVVVDCGTTSYVPTLEFARRLAERGVRFTDAPVSGMEARAEEGTLLLLARGEMPDDAPGLERQPEVLTCGRFCARVYPRRRPPSV
jgi:3-hydroxyisobutyrate dehydrogenase-like beta-hydroxyacid dehydrogenase